MAVKLYRSGESEPVLVMDTVQNIVFDIQGNVMDIPIPDEQNAFIMNLGGVSRKIRLDWTLVSKDVAGVVARLGFQILDGRMFNSFVIEIEEWSLKEDCVIQSITIRQKAGEPGKFDVSIAIIIGEVI
jgi:hypothetical protein